MGFGDDRPHHFFSVASLDNTDHKAGGLLQGFHRLHAGMGKEVIVHLIGGEYQFEAVVDPRTDFHVGNQVQVAMNLDNVHIFDQETEIAIR